MSIQVSLSDRFDLSRRHVLLNGTQALVRLMLMQAARDSWRTSCTPARVFAAHSRVRPSFDSQRNNRPMP